MSKFRTPVLFLIFNRPDATQRVFDEIKKAKPLRLYVAADGPRSNKEGESDRCEETRKIIRQVDWECEVATLFREENLGCKKAVSSAIDWFFGQEEEGIILEDDCLPDPSFFGYCQELLEKYRDDDRVMMISGDNFQDGAMRGDGSYYFSKNVHIWGWASWRRAWNKYDVTMRSYPEFRKQGRIESVFQGKILQQYWLSIFDSVFSGKIDTWDYQWVYAVWANGSLSIIPNVNLISNIGFRNDATHTRGTESEFANMDTKALGAINHPRFVMQDRRADDSFYRKHHSGSYQIFFAIKQKLL